MGKSPKSWQGSAAACSLEEEEDGEDDAFLEAGKDYLPDSSFYVTTTRSGRPALARNKNDQLLRDHGFDILGQSFGIPSRIDYERGNHADMSPSTGPTGRAAPGLSRRFRELLLHHDEVAPAKESRTSRRHRAASTSVSARTPHLVPVAYSTATEGLLHSETGNPPESRGTHVPSKASLTRRKHVPAKKYLSSSNGGSEAMSPGGILKPSSVQHYLPPAPPAPPQSMQSHHPLHSISAPYAPSYSTMATVGGSEYTGRGAHVFPQCCGPTHPPPVSYANLPQAHTMMADYAVPQTGSLHPIPHQQAGLAPGPKLHSAFMPGFVIPPPPPPPILPGTPAGPADAVKVTAPESKKPRANDEAQRPSKGGNIQAAGDVGKTNKHVALVSKEDLKRTSAEVLSEAALSEHTHFCAACGKTRSRGYHMTHLVKKGERPEAGYCRRCVAHADYTDSDSSVTGTSRSLGVKNLPSPAISTDEDFLISSGRYVHDERSRRHKLHQKPRRSSFLKGFLPESVKSKSSGRTPGSLSSAEEASSRASSLVQDPQVYGKIALRRAARKKKSAQSRVHPRLQTQTEENSSKSPVEALPPTETSKSPMLPRVTVSQHPDTASPASTNGRVPDIPGYHKPVVDDDEHFENSLQEAATKSAKGGKRSRESSRQPKQGRSACHTGSTSERSAESRVQSESRTRETKGCAIKQAGSASGHSAQTKPRVAEASSKKGSKHAFNYMPPTPVDWVPADYGAQPRVADDDGAWGEDFSEAEEMAAMLAEEELLQAGKRSGLFGGSWGGSATSSCPQSSLLTPSLISIESCSSDEERTDGNGHYEMAEAEAEVTETEGCEETSASGSWKRYPKQLEFSSRDDQASKTSSRRKSPHGRQRGGSISKMPVPLFTRTSASSSMRGLPKSDGRSSLSSHSSDFQPPGEESSVLAHTGHSMEDMSRARNTTRNTVTTDERTPLRGLHRLGSFFRSP